MKLPKIRLQIYPNGTRRKLYRASGGFAHSMPNLIEAGVRDCCRGYVLGRVKVAVSWYSRTK